MVGRKEGGMISWGFIESMRQRTDQGLKGENNGIV